MSTANIKTIVKTHAWLLSICLITAAIIISFQLIGQLVIYRYLKLDHYISLVAVVFLATGFQLNRTARTEINNNRIEPAIQELQQPQPAALPAEATVETSTALHSQPNLLRLLTTKEFLVLRLLAEGKTNKEIAAAHTVEVSTIKTHINNIYNKLAISNRAQARARYAEIAASIHI